MTYELRALLDACVDAVLIIDHRGIVETFNPAAERLFGYAAAEMIGSNVNALMPEPDRSSHDGYIQRFLDTRDPHVIGRGRSVEARRRDGSTFPASLTVGQIGGIEPPRFVGFLHDLSERRAHELQILRQDALLREAQRIAQIGNFEVHVPARAGDNGSEEFHRILGLPPDRPVSLRALGERLRPADRERFEAALRQLQAERATAELNAEYQVLLEDGEARHVHLNMRVGSGPDGSIRYVGTLHDVTDRRRAQDTMRETQERLTHVARLSTMGEMTNGLAHELNQPLTAIALYAQAAERLMTQSHPAEEEVISALHQIATQALRAGEIIRRLRAMVKNRETREEEVDLNELVLGLVILAEADARLHSVHVWLDLSETPLKVMADSIQLQQVLLNLVRNAIEAVQDLDMSRRTVKLRTAATALGDAEVSVNDLGPGVDPAISDRLFDAFFTTKPEGTGLGLAISRSIIENHGGRLAQRPNDPVGSCFFFTLPALKGDQT
jgi:two-component system sensor kinase FixL